MIDPSIPVTCPNRLDGGPAAGPRIFVFGSARSGTTLLLNLFRTFHDVTVLDHEHCVRELVTDPARGWLVAKRTPHCADHLDEDRPGIGDVWIVDIVRDGRDVVTSRLAPFPGYYCDFPRWQRDVHAAARLRGTHLRLLQLKYEHLAAAGDEVQAALAGILGLRIQVPFSEHLSVVPPELSEQARSALGGLRSLSADRVDRWRRDPDARVRVAQQLAAHPGMESLLAATGYPPTGTEVHP
ncbi:hypothetical protein FDG2_3359 [Candidatus Protofrankia californiensis]|uniref:Sulfotransferase n=1 Tax=Candidatus Protofrankia californiensis TaxID=1839754 RepID=A0A1C3NZE5_9ACTN|nr:hypothetical protein FDG2_3359 [Candidatus Protofrankia californiensis]